MKIRPGRCFIASVLGAGLLAGPVQAAGVRAGSLAPGMPAGVRKAQLDRTTVAVVSAGVLLIAGFSVLIAGAQNDDTADTVIAGGSGATTLVNNNVSTTTTSRTH